MKRKIVFRFLFFSGIFLGVFSSCKEIDLTGISNDILIDESLVIPIGEGSASINDVLKKVVDNSNLLIEADTVNYVSNYTYQYKFKDIDILQYQAPRNIPIDGFEPATIPANQAITLPVSNFTVELGLDPASTNTTKRVDSTYVTSTAVGITVTSSNITLASGGAISPSDLKVTLGFPKMYYQSDRSQVSKPIPYSFGVPYNLSLNNVIVDTKGLTGVPVTVSLTSGGRQIKVNASSSINIIISFNSVNFSVSYGLFQPSSVQTTNIAVPLDMLQSLPKGMTFANPKAFINVQSNIGSYLDYYIDYVKAYNKSGTVVKNASFNGTPSASEVINKKPSSPGGFISYDLKTLDKNYGTTNQLFETNDVLDTLKYQFSLTADPNSPKPSYVIPGMQMTANVRIQIPMYLEKGSTYDYTDTIKYENKEISYVDSAVLVLKVTNGLPVQGKFTMKLLDANNHVMNSSLNDSIYLIKSANVGNNGLVTSSVDTKLNIILTSSQLADVKNAKAFSYTVFLSGQDATKEIQFTKNNVVTVKVGVFAKGGKTVNIGSTKN